jgi:hypothetical protein
VISRSPRQGKDWVWRILCLGIAKQSTTNIERRAQDIGNWYGGQFALKDSSYKRALGYDFAGLVWVENNCFSDKAVACHVTSHWIWEEFTMLDEASVQMGKHFLGLSS